MKGETYCHRCVLMSVFKMDYEVSVSIILLMLSPLLIRDRFDDLMYHSYEILKVNNFELILMNKSRDLMMR